MTVTILSLVCIVLAVLCCCLWVYASMANGDLIEAQWEADYYQFRCEEAGAAYSAALEDIKELKHEVVTLQQRHHLES